MARPLSSEAAKILAAARAQELQREIETKYQDLTVGAVSSQIVIRGAFPVLHEGKVLDRYQIELQWSDSDREIPILRETGGRIPWIADRHMSQGGLGCLFVPEEWLLRPREERTLTQYLDGPVRNYFLWQSLFEGGESPPWKERSHGVPGLIEAYGDLVGMQDEQAIRSCLVLLSKDTIKGHWECPCGSGQRLRHCHLQHVRDLTLKIPRHIARLALRRLENPIMR
jgi:hypothetical protein